jgi:hypothetical protein
VRSFSCNVRAFIVQRAFDETLSEACIVYKRLTFIVFRVSFFVYGAFESVRLLSFSVRMRPFIVWSRTFK